VHSYDQLRKLCIQNLKKKQYFIKEYPHAMFGVIAG